MSTSPGTSLLSLTPDPLTPYLLFLISLILLVHIFLRPAAEPQTHPFLLGKQCEWEKVRRKGQSSAFRTSYVPSTSPAVPLPSSTPTPSSGPSASSPSFLISSLPPTAAAARLSLASGCSTLAPNLVPGHLSTKTGSGIRAIGDVVRRRGELMRTFGTDKEVEDGGMKDVLLVEALGRGLEELVAGKNGGGEGSTVGIWTGEGEGELHAAPLLAASLLPNNPPHQILSISTSIPPSSTTHYLASLLSSSPPNNLSPVSVLFVTSSTFSLARSTLLTAMVSGAVGGRRQNLPPLVWLGTGADEGVELWDGKEGIKVLRASDLVSRGKGLVERKREGESDTVDPNRPFITAVMRDGTTVKLSHRSLLVSLSSFLSLWPSSPVPPSSSKPWTALLSTKPSPTDRILSFLSPAPSSTPGSGDDQSVKSSAIGGDWAGMIGLQVGLMGWYAGAAKVVAKGLGRGVEKKQVEDVVKKEKPTIIVATPSTMNLLASSLRSTARSLHPWLAGRAYASKLSLLREGALARGSWADSQVFQDVRKSLGLESTRAIIIVSDGNAGDGKIQQPTLDTLRTVLSCPVFTTLAHPLLPGLVTASGIWDFQWWPEKIEDGWGEEEKNRRLASHTGPPATGVEGVLVGMEEDVDGEKGRIEGELLVRSPSIPLSIIPPPSSLQAPSPTHDFIDLGASSASITGSSIEQVRNSRYIVKAVDGADLDWFKTGWKAELKKNGTVKIIG